MILGPNLQSPILIDAPAREIGSNGGAKFLMSHNKLSAGL